MFTWSLTYQQRVFDQYHSNEDFSAFYLQDDGENGRYRYEIKLRHCHATGNESVQPKIILNGTIIFLLKLQSAFLVISNHNGFRELF